MSIGWVNNHSVLSRVVGIEHGFYEHKSDEYYLGLVMTKPVAIYLAKLIRKTIDCQNWSAKNRNVEQLELLRDAVYKLSHFYDRWYLRFLNQLNKRRSLKNVRSSFILHTPDFFSYGYVNKLPVLSLSVHVNHSSFFSVRRFDFYYMLVMSRAVCDELINFLNYLLQDFESDDLDINVEQLRFLLSSSGCCLNWDKLGYINIVNDELGKKAVLKRPKL